MMDDIVALDTSPKFSPFSPQTSQLSHWQDLIKGSPGLQPFQALLSDLCLCRLQQERVKGEQVEAPLLVGEWGQPP